MIEKETLPVRMIRFFFVFGFALFFIYGLLPLLTGSVDVLTRMSLSLDETGIDPSSYNYTDVEQVIESEQYLRTVLDDN